MFPAEVLIFRAISPQSPMKIKSFSLKQNFSMQKKVAACSNGHPRGMCCTSFLEQLSCRCGGGLVRLSSQPALLGMSATGDFSQEATLLLASSAPLRAPQQPQPPASRPTQAPSAVCSPGWGWDPARVSICCDPARQGRPRSSTGPESVHCLPGDGGPKQPESGAVVRKAMPGPQIIHSP